MFCRFRDANNKLFYLLYFLFKKVLGAPKIILENDFSPLYYTETNLNGREKFLRLPCNAIGNPKPLIKWFQNGKIEEVI